VQQKGRLADTFTCKLTGQLAKALLGLENTWKQTMIEQNYCLEMMEELRQVVGFKCLSWALLKRAIVIKAPKSLGCFAYLL